MSEPFDKRISGHCGLIISPNNYNKSLGYFMKMAAEAANDFPSLHLADIEVFVITKSINNQGFGGIRFSLPKGVTEYKDYKKGAIDFTTT